MASRSSSTSVLGIGQVRAPWRRIFSHPAYSRSSVDIRLGGYAHDLLHEPVRAELRELAAFPLCVGVLASVPCGSWSVLRYVDNGGPTVARRLPHFARGIPRPDGSLPPSVVKGNSILDLALDLTDTVVARGGFGLFESPVGRGEGSQWPMEGREDHASMWSYPELITRLDAWRFGDVHFDQCRTGLLAQKTTQLSMSPELHPAFRAAFASLVCDHGGHTERIPGPVDGDGRYRSAEFARYTVHMNELLAHAIDASLPRLTRLPESIRATLRLRGGGGAPTTHAAALCRCVTLAGVGQLLRLGGVQWRRGRR